MGTELPNFKKFVSEDDIAAAKKKRQEEWEKVRRPDQPEEAPEEEYDPRSLFERLEANRLKKQEEFDEAHRLKNMVKGLENDEIEFLERVSQLKEKEELEKDLEERMLLAEYKSSLVHDRTAEQEEEVKAVAKKPAAKQTVQQKPVKSQKSLLAGVIRKKSSSDSVESSVSKKLKRSSEVNGCATSDAHVKVVDKQDGAVAKDVKVKPVAGLLPGIGDYSDSESDSSTPGG